jgi:hypothetical protein
METKNWKNTGFTLIEQKDEVTVKCERCGHKISKREIIRNIPEDIPFEAKMNIAIRAHNRFNHG